MTRTEIARAMPAAQVLWDWLRLDEEPVQADCIAGFGCYNEDIPRRAAQLYHQGYAPVVLFSGGLGRNTRQMWDTSEAERYAAIAMAEGVPESAILLETNSTNTAENIRFTRRVLAEAGITPRRILGIHKPYMERRLAAAWGVYWPEMPLTVTSWQQTMQAYMAVNEQRGRSREATVSMLVGDFQRMIVYAELGYQLPQTIPQSAADAYLTLKNLGFTAELIPGKE